MVRGCQKKIIYLKNTGSEVFDEAYFIVKDNTKCDVMGECDMVEEANRILDNVISCRMSGEKIDRIKKFIKVKILPFTAGIIIGILIGLLIKSKG
ncbi:MAG: hypothetical protein IKC61_04050 [Clostridia bacterium]|nr:hypothetical protein [Clostridia bacterium]